MTEKIFPDGFRVKSVETRFGELLKVSIKSNEFMDFLAKYTNDKGYLNIDIKKGQSGNWYSELNTYKKATEDNTSNEPVMGFDDIDDEEVPF